MGSRVAKHSEIPPCVPFVQPGGRNLLREGNQPIVHYLVNGFRVARVHPLHSVDDGLRNFNIAVRAFPVDAVGYLLQRHQLTLWRHAL